MRARGIEHKLWRFICGMMAAGAMALCVAPAMAQRSDQPFQVKSVVMAETDFGLEWVDVTGLDPNEVSAALETLVSAFTEGYENNQFFVIRSTDKVAVHGTEHQRQVVREVLTNLSPVSRTGLGTRVMRLAPGADLEMLSNIAQLPGMAELEIEGELLIARGSRDQLASTENNLFNAELVGGETKTTCSTVRLYYLRDADSVRALLQDVPETLRGDAVVLASSDTSGRQTLVLTGSQESVRNLRRIIATLDVPQPEVRLDIWAFQISGGKAEEVAERAARAQDRIALVSGLIRGYLSQLEGLAQDQMMHNEELLEQLGPLVEAAEEAQGRGDDDEAAETARQALLAQISRMGLDSLGTDYLLTPSARGRHPLSLTETLAALLTTPPAAVVDAELVEAAQTGSSNRMSIAVDLGPLLGAVGGAAADTAGAQARSLEAVMARRLERWLLQVAANDPRTVCAWAEMVEADPAPGEEQVCDLLAALRRSVDEGRRPNAMLGPEALVPRRLLTTIADPTFSRTAASTITDFLALRGRLQDDWSSVPAEQLRMRAADVQTVLQTAERALADDVARLFLRPLERELRRIAAKGGQAGLGSTSRTSISVLSGTQAEVVGSAISYFEVSRSPELTTEALYRSEEFSRALSGLLPPRSQRDPVRQVVRIELDTGKVTNEELEGWPYRLQAILPGLQSWVYKSAGSSALMVVGTSEEINSAVNILRTSGVVSGVRPATAGLATAGAPGLAEAPLSVASPAVEGVAEAVDLPAGRLLALAMELGRKEEVWAALTEGAQLTFTPSILPGGSAAEVAIDFTVSHDDGGTTGEGAAPVPLSRVAQHTARTSVYVQALDLFALSSFTLQTTHPRPDSSIPVLGRIPIIGQMFRFPRSPATVHHESVLMVYSTILPTGADLAELLDVGGVGEQ